MNEKMRGPVRSYTAHVERLACSLACKFDHARHGQASHRRVVSADTEALVARAGTGDMAALRAVDDVLRSLVGQVPVERRAREAECVAAAYQRVVDAADEEELLALGFEVTQVLTSPPGDVYPPGHPFADERS